jgi:hypothetical protein
MYCWTASYLTDSSTPMKRVSIELRGGVVEGRKGELSFEIFEMRGLGHGFIDAVPLSCSEERPVQ